MDLERFSRALRLRWLWFSWSSPDQPWKGTTLPVDSVDMALFNAATRVTVHNGCKASFWNSSWLDGRTPAALFPSLYKHSRRKKRTVREALLGQRWIKDVAYNLNHELLHEYFEIWTAIVSAQVNLQDEQDDEIVWILEGSGKYSASSAYSIQFVGQELSPFPKLVWKAWAPPRCKVFLWLLLKDRLWTAARLQIQG